MRKLSNKYGGLQFFAPAPADLIINFDSNVTKVVGVALGSGNTDLEWSTSGTAYKGLANDGTTYTFNVTLASGYIIDKVTLSDPDTAAGKLVSISDTSFQIIAGSGRISQTVTITSKQSANRISVDLATAFPTQWAALEPGEHTIQIRAKNPGNYLDSDLSTAITFVKVVNWSVNITATNCTADASNPTVVPSNTTAENPVILKFNKVTGYKLPTSLILDGIADDGYTWTVSSDGAVGTITINDPSGNITGTVAGTVESYNITVNATHASKASGPSTITYGGSATLTFTYEDGYFAPASVTVTGATSSWNQSTSTLSLTNCTGTVTVTIAGAIKTYTITPNLTNCSWDDINPSTIDSNRFEAVELVINKNTGWTLPNEITVSGVDAEYWSWNQATGIVTISHPQGNVTVTANAVRETYNITTNLTHALAGSGNPTTIGYGLSATLTFSFPTGYEAPTDVTVTGATKSWAAGSGTLTLSNATGPVTVTVVGVATTTTISGQYKWYDDISLTEWSQDVNFTSNGVSFSAMRYTGDGTAMTLQYLDADAEWTTVYDYDEDEGSGTWTNDAYKIVDFGTTAQTVTAIWKADFLANASELTQLATPQNVSADGTVVSWDEVENATSYDVLADGTSIGTVTPSTGETWVLNSPTTTVPSNTTINFVANKIEFEGMRQGTGSATAEFFFIPVDGNIGNKTVAGYSPLGWTWTEAYRTIVLESPATGDLLTWLTANGVKQ